MASFRKSAIAVLTAASVGTAAFAVPAFAGQSSRGFDPARLDKAQAEYSQYRRGWYRGGHYYRGNRGAAIAAGVGLGILGAAAIASSQRAYADPYYDYDDGYYAAPVYAPPVVYAPAPRYYGRPYGYYPDNIRDPAGGSYR